MIDVLTVGELLVEIMREESGVPLKKAGTFKGPFPSGAPAIFIDTVARMGCKASIIGGIGQDAFGDNILERMKRDQVITDYIHIDSLLPTASAFVSYDKEGGRDFIFHVNGLAATNFDVPMKIEKTKYMHIMGCSLTMGKSMTDKILSVLDIMLKMGTKITFDPNIRKELLHSPDSTKIMEHLLSITSIFLPGREELLLITRSNSVEEAIKKCFTYSKMELVVVKNGSNGSIVFTSQSKEEIKPFLINEEIDPTGAGDCFDGAFLASLIRGKNIIESAQMGSVAGALNVLKMGPMEGDISWQKVSSLCSQYY